MALDPSNKYVGRIQAPDANYTYGSSKDETSPGANDGTPHEKDRANDIFGFQQALLKLASIVPSGSSETQLVSQYIHALVELAAGRAVNYDESGIVNVYVADLRTNQQGPQSLYDGLLVKFTPGADNTAASTINVNGLGVASIFFNGVALTGGELLTTEKATIEYDLTNTRWNLIKTPDASETVKGLIELANQAEVDAGTDTTRAVTPATLGGAPVAAGSVAQASLKTTTGEVSTTSGGAELTLPGGEYGFYPQLKSVGGDSILANISQAYNTASYNVNIYLGLSTPAGTAFAQQRYVQSSPPYDLGNGIIQMFVFILLDKTTKDVLATYSAPDPVWANNGPTTIHNLGPVVIDDKFSNDSKLLKNYLDKLRGASKASKVKGKRAKFEKFTPLQKNADMNLIPHPFPDYDAAKHVVVMLDPVSDFNDDLFNIHEYSGDSIAEILHAGHIHIDNSSLALTMPRDVIACKGRFK